jgi:hypothetical protein
VATYVVLQDCHSPGYTTQALEAAFTTEPRLRELVKGYDVTDRGGAWLNPARLEDLASGRDDSFTFVAQARVTITPPASVLALMDRGDDDSSLSVGPLVVYSSLGGNGDGDGDDDDDDGCSTTRDGRSKKPLRQALGWQGQVVLTRDYYRWLKDTFGGDCLLSSVDWVLFWKTSPALNQVYGQLIELRSTTPNPLLVTFIKRIVNLSAGFYGNRSSLLNNRTTFRLVKGVPKNYVFFRHFIDPHHTVDLGDESYFLLETRPWPQAPRDKRQATKSAVALFLGIVEYGKLRLVQMFHFLRQHLGVGRFKWLYTNIDNWIMALATTGDLEDAVDPAQRESFLAHKHEYFTSTAAVVKPAGLAELKWTKNTPESLWKLITLRTQHYCVASDHPEEEPLHKVSGLRGLSSQQAFAQAEQQLQGQRVDIWQTRRVNKMQGMATRDVLFHY